MFFCENKCTVKLVWIFEAQKERKNYEQAWLALGWKPKIEYGSGRFLTFLTLDLTWTWARQWQLYFYIDRSFKVKLVRKLSVDTLGLLEKSVSLALVKKFQKLRKKKYFAKIL